MGWLSAQLSDQAMFDEAYSVALTVSPESTRDSIFQDITEFQAEAGLIRNALKAAFTLSNKGEKLRTLGDIASTVNNDKLYGELATYALRFTEGDDKNVGILGIIRALAESGRTDAAIEIANAIPENGFRANALGTVGAATHDADFVIEALSLVQTSESYDSDFKNRPKPRS
jgi:hypothetical protein